MKVQFHVDVTGTSLRKGAYASWNPAPNSVTIAGSAAFISLDYRGGAMSLHDRIESLRARHRTLEEAIDQEKGRPWPNIEALADLKRQKLRIKDEIFQLEHAP